MAFKRASGHEHAPDDQPAAALADGRMAITVAVRRLLFFKEDTGFFVASAEPEGPIDAPPGAIVHQKGVASLTIKGISPSMAEHKAGYSLRCYGRWVRDPSFGQQFEIDVIHEEIPATSEGLRKYLAAGRVKGIGPAMAGKIVDRWGLETLEILNENPAKLAEIPGITPEKARQISVNWQAKKVSFSSVAFLGQHGIGELTALKIADHFGPEGLEARLRADPYMLTQVDGVGFKTADQMALSLGFDMFDHRRMNAAIEHVLLEKTNQEGHTALPFEQWVTEAARYLNQTPAAVRPRCQALIEDRKVVLRTIDRPIDQGGPVDETIPVPCISLPKVHAMERGIAQHLLRLREQQVGLSPAERLRVLQALSDPACTLDPSQRAAVETALDDSFSILTGGPGTGKTTTLRTLVRIAKEALGWTVELAAPTGRASKRMEDAIGQSARTMHRQLEFNPKDGFRRTETNPMFGNLFVLDEVSMVDTPMAYSWLRAIPKNARVLWVGDADQLPSVGPGEVLRNCLDSGLVRTSRLTQLHRQAAGSDIPWNARRVLTGQPPNMDQADIRQDFAFLRTNDNAEICSAVESTIERLLADGFRAEDIQILCPQKGGEVGTEALNHRLRLLLNPHRPKEYPETAGWMVGDRLMQTKNNYDLNVFNGDMGTVTAVNEDGSVVLAMEADKSGDMREVVFDKKSALSLVLGYAITVHKSQGGERPVIIMPISRSHSFSLHRNLLYTGITRGKKKVILVGDARTALLAAKKVDASRRVTGLTEELREMLEVGPLPASGPRPR